MSTPLDRLSEIEARTAKATEGHHLKGCGTSGKTSGVISKDSGANWPMPDGPDKLASVALVEDADFIAAARTDVERLCEALRRSLEWHRVLGDEGNPEGEKQAYALSPTSPPARRESGGSHARNAAPAAQPTQTQNKPPRNGAGAPIPRHERVSRKRHMARLALEDARQRVAVTRP